MAEVPEHDHALLVIVGPTASGKSHCGIDLALALGGEIVSADSMQVYRCFDIGTGKVSPADRARVPHHLLDICDPDERFCAASFVERADAVIAEIAARGRLPVVVGGTGLYVQALLRGLFETPPPDPEIRARHDAERREKGIEALYGRLGALDANAAAKINPNDFVRISRALEVYEQMGVPISTLQQQHKFSRARYPAYVLGIEIERQALRARIEARVDEMMASGWLDEVRALVAAGYGEAHAMGGLGYRQLRAHLRGELDLDEAVRQTKRDTWRFARRQRNWFSQQEGVDWRPLARCTEHGPVAAKVAALSRGG